MVTQKKINTHFFKLKYFGFVFVLLFCLPVFAQILQVNPNTLVTNLELVNTQSNENSTTVGLQQPMYVQVNTVIVGLSPSHLITIAPHKNKKRSFTQKVAVAKGTKTENQPTTIVYQSNNNPSNRLYFKPLSCHVVVPSHTSIKKCSKTYLKSYNYSKRLLQHKNRTIETNGQFTLKWYYKQYPYTFFGNLPPPSFFA